jgi:fatty acid desaturase
MNVLAGLIELAGAVAAMIVAGIWARLAITQFTAAGVLLIAVAAWSLTNVWYSIAFILQHGFDTVIWDTWQEQAAETVQQAATITTPLATVFLIGQLMKDRRRAVQPE